MTFAADQVRREVAVIAFHFHWSFDQILDLEHVERRRFLREIERLVREG